MVTRRLNSATKKQTDWGYDLKTRIVSKVVLQCDDGQILLLKRSDSDKRRPGQWDIPGGIVDQGEFPTEAAARETVEEAGIITDARDLRLVYAMTEKVQDDLSVTWLFYYGQTTQTQVTVSKEHADYAWVSVDEAIERTEYDRQKRMLEYLCGNQLLN